MRILDRGFIFQASGVFVSGKSLYFVRYIMISALKNGDPYRPCEVNLAKTDGFFIVSMRFPDRGLIFEASEAVHLSCIGKGFQVYLRR